MRWWRSAIVRRRLAGILPLVLMIVALAGCDLPGQPRAPQRSRLAPDQQQVLRVEGADYDWSLPPEPLDPVSATGYTPLQPLVLLYSGLVALAGDGHPTLLAADQLHISADGLDYTFHLRAGLRFSDGASITAADIAYSLNRALDPCVLPLDTGSPYALPNIPGKRMVAPMANLLFAIKDAQTFNRQTCSGQRTIIPAQGQSAQLISTLIGTSIVVPDSATLVLHLGTLDPSFLVKLTFPIASVVERGLVERYGDSWSSHISEQGGQGTSGMYSVASTTTTDQRLSSLTLVRDPRYWGAQPLVREVRFGFARTGQVRDDYLAGRIDLVSSSERGVWRAARNDLGYAASPAPSLDYLAVNWHQAPLDDLRVRQALALALDKTTIAAQVTNAPAVETNHLVPLGAPGYNPQLTGPLGVVALTGDAVRARMLWLAYVADRCGGDAARCPEIRLTGGVCGVQPIPDALAQSMVASWQQALPGARIRFTGNHVGTSCILFSLTRLPCVPMLQLWHKNWGTAYPDQRLWLAPLFEPGAPDSIFNVPGAQPCTADAAASALLQAAEGERDAGLRTYLFQRAEQDLIEDVALIPLYQEEAAWEVRPYVLHYPTTYRYWIAPAEWATIAIARQ